MCFIKMFKHPALLSLFFVFGLACAVSAQHTVNGVVVNEENEPLWGANVLLPDLNRGVSSDTDGKFAISDLPKGEIRFVISYLGYETVDTLLTIPLTVEIQIQLRQSDAYLEQVALQARAVDSDMSRQAPLSTTYISRLRIEQSQRMLGEPDLARLVQMIPGVKAESDYSGGFHVRGGRNDQNLILLDGMPVYNPWHMFGLFSALNADVVTGVEFNKGVFPARFGGRLSSVLNVNMADGDNVNFFDQLNIGLLSSTLSLGGKIGSRSSIYMAARRTYIDPFLSLIDNHERKTDLSTGTLDQTTRYHFWDTNAKFRHRFRDNLQLDVNFFYSTDKFSWNVDEALFRENEATNTFESRESDSESVTRIGWDNIAASAMLKGESGPVNWAAQLYTTYFNSENTDVSSQFFDGLFRRVTGTVNNIVIRTEIREEMYELDKEFSQEILDFGGKLSLESRLNENLLLNTGGEVVFHQFSKSSRLYEHLDRFEITETSGMPPDIRITDRLIDRLLDESISPRVLAGFAGLELSVGAFRVYPGLRYEHYRNDETNYQTLLPRINLGYELGMNWYFNAGYGRFRQYFQSIGFDIFRFPVESWIWPDENVRPVDADTWTLGLQRSLGLLGFLTVEAYHRKFHNLSDIDPIESFKAMRATGSMVPAYRDITVRGEGEAYGIETALDLRTDIWSLHLSYSLSTVRNRFNEINNGDWFPSRFDSPHDVTVNATWNFSREWQTGLHFVYKTGQPVSMAFTGYDREDDPFGIGQQIDSPPFIWAGRNNYRLPDYHRLDLFISRRNIEISSLFMDITFSVINVYNRMNVFAINKTTGFERPTTGNSIYIDPSYRYLTQLPVLPMINLRLKRIRS